MAAQYIYCGFFRRKCNKNLLDSSKNKKSRMIQNHSVKINASCRDNPSSYVVQSSSVCCDYMTSGCVCQVEEHALFLQERVLRLSFFSYSVNYIHYFPGDDHQGIIQAIVYIKYNISCKELFLFFGHSHIEFLNS